LHQAEDGYARDFSELTLQQILRRLARLLERKARANAAKLAAKKDVTLLHPPPDHDPTFYPDKLKKFPQYRDYFFKKEAKEDARILTHMHKGRAKPPCVFAVTFLCQPRVLYVVPCCAFRITPQHRPTRPGLPRRRHRHHLPLPAREEPRRQRTCQGPFHALKRTVTPLSPPLLCTA
jgi:hypothetical protein